MNKLIWSLILLAIISSSTVSCRSRVKHCAALDDTMEGYKPPKKKKNRQEGLFSKKMRLEFNALPSDALEQ